MNGLLNTSFVVDRQLQAKVVDVSFPSLSPLAKRLPPTVFTVICFYALMRRVAASSEVWGWFPKIRELRYL